MHGFMGRGLGWHRDLADPRDFRPTDPPVRALLKGLGRRGSRSSRPARVDWRAYGSAIRDQGHLPSCTAHACAALVEYFIRRATGMAYQGSPLFLHQTTGRLLHGATGPETDLRTTLKAMIRFGLPPEQHWPYRAEYAQHEPEAFLYSFARELEGLTYVRLDGTTGAETREAVRSYLAAGLPSVLGFSVFSSATEAADIPAPTIYDRVCGGQAVVAVGYDDGHRIRSTRGALLVRNCWGADWGDGGHGWLPYSYVDEGLAADFWTILKADWLGSGEFESPV